MKQEITQAYVKELFDYDPITGIVTRLKRTTRKAGSERSINNISLTERAGTVMASGYRCIRLHKKTYREHRLIWLWMTGEMPDHQIDHINRDRSDNRWCNLRKCNNTENQQNRNVSKKSKTGYIGVFLHKNGFTAQIVVNKKTVYLGRYKTAEEAAEAYKQAKAKYHTFNPQIK
jgi:hypothetical protein